MRFADFCFRVENSGVALGVEGAGFSELGVARVSVEGSGVTFRGIIQRLQLKRFIFSVSESQDR